MPLWTNFLVGCGKNSFFGPAASQPKLSMSKGEFVAKAFLAAVPEHGGVPQSSNPIVSSCSK